MNNTAMIFCLLSSGLFHKCIKFGSMAFSSGTSIRIANGGNLYLPYIHYVELIVLSSCNEVIIAF